MFEDDENDRAFKALQRQLEVWSIPDEAVNAVHDVARSSLTEVKSLTEYEDGKVARLLTIIAFLSVVVAAVFSRFASDYAWPQFYGSPLRIISIIISATYISFFYILYLLRGL